VGEIPTSPCPLCFLEVIVAEDVMTPVVFQKKVIVDLADRIRKAGELGIIPSDDLKRICTEINTIIQYIDGIDRKIISLLEGKCLAQSKLIELSTRHSDQILGFYQELHKKEKEIQGDPTKAPEEDPTDLGTVPPKKRRKKSE
jgi:hypothetical protein